MGQRPLQVAIKIVKYPAEKASTHFRREASVWALLRHEHLVPLVGFVKERNILISPFYEHRHIGEYLEENSAANRPRLVLSLFFSPWKKLILKSFHKVLGVASGLACLHANQIVHGHLKPANILIDDQGSAVISDFGISKVVDQHGFTTYGVGTECYMAPELFVVVSPGINPRPRHGSRTSKSSDIYSFALVALEILTSKRRKRRPGGIFITEGILLDLRAERTEYHGTLKNGLWEVLDPCLSFEPGARPCTKDVLDQLTVVFNALD
ncbi:Glycoside hydrolase family 76 protein [Mycena venus]|uniref:Glycoside hydrolase family 76 protein n=1 Tax=Mycena venus TaxID=2733690 RepID=A0A8H6X2P6_9AGAR|nr:Glycoside hydrolase family 76 protein [Mycena venus]